VKRTLISMTDRTEHHLLSGRVFSVDRRLERNGGNIYLDRTYSKHESISAVRTVLIPQLHLWLMFFEGQPGPHPIRCYMHMARIMDEGNTIMVEDLYLDVLVREDGRWHLVDVDEFRRAVAKGELTSDQVQAALEGLENACRLVDLFGKEIESNLDQSIAPRLGLPIPASRVV